MPSRVRLLSLPLYLASIPCARAGVAGPPGPGHWWSCAPAARLFLKAPVRRDAQVPPEAARNQADEYVGRRKLNGRRAILARVPLRGRLDRAELSIRSLAELKGGANSKLNLIINGKSIKLEARLWGRVKHHQDVTERAVDQSPLEGVRLLARLEDDPQVRPLLEERRRLPPQSPAALALGRRIESVIEKIYIQNFRKYESDELMFIDSDGNVHLIPEDLVDLPAKGPVTKTALGELKLPFAVTCGVQVKSNCITHAVVRSLVRQSILRDEYGDAVDHPLLKTVVSREYARNPRLTRILDQAIYARTNHPTLDDMKGFVGAVLDRRGPGPSAIPGPDANLARLLEAQGISSRLTRSLDEAIAEASAGKDVLVGFPVTDEVHDPFSRQLRLHSRRADPKQHRYIRYRDPATGERVVSVIENESLLPIPRPRTPQIYGREGELLLIERYHVMHMEPPLTFADADLPYLKRHPQLARRVGWSPLSKRAPQVMVLQDDQSSYPILLNADQLRAAPLALPPVVPANPQAVEALYRHLVVAPWFRVIEPLGPPHP